MRAWAVWLRWYLAHGSILTLAICIASEQPRFKSASKVNISLSLRTLLTVGMAAATLATMAALAPATTPSAQPNMINSSICVNLRKRKVHFETYACELPWEQRLARASLWSNWLIELILEMKLTWRFGRLANDQKRIWKMELQSLQWLDISGDLMSIYSRERD